MTDQSDVAMLPDGCRPSEAVEGAEAEPEDVAPVMENGDQWRMMAPDGDSDTGGDFDGVPTSLSLPLSPRTTPRMGRRVMGGEMRMRIKTNGSLGRSGSGGATPTGATTSSTTTATASSSSSLCASSSLAAAAAAALNGEGWPGYLSADLDSPNGNSSLGLSDEDLRVDDEDEDEDEDEEGADDDDDEDAIGLQAAQAEEAAAEGGGGGCQVRRTASMSAASLRQHNGDVGSPRRRRRTNSEGRSIDALLCKRRQLCALKKQLRYFHQAKRDVLQRLMHLKQQITDVESREMETMREMELERALLDGEYQSELSLVRMEKDHMLNLRKEHSVQLQILLDEQNENEEAIEMERLKLMELEEQHSKLERRLQAAELTDADNSDLRIQLEVLEERVEAQRKIYEDLEFRQLEDQARFDEEREGMLQELMMEQNGMLDKYRERENRLQALDSQQTSMLADVRRNIDQLELDRRQLLEQFKKEKTKLAIADGRISELSRQFASVKLDDSSTTQKPIDTSRDVASSAAASASISAAAAGANIPAAAAGSSGEQSAFQPISPAGVRPQATGASAAGPATQNGWGGLDSESGSGGSSSLGTQSNPSLPGEDSTSGPSQHGATGSSSSREGLSGSNAVALRSQAREVNEQSRPLTRYLPVTDPNFNLRRYIESCGHPVEMCREKVHIAAHTCRGYLWKMGGRIRSWRKRWFCFDRQHKRLIYCSRAPKHHAAGDEMFASELHKSKGLIAFADILDVFVDHLHRVKSPQPPLTFCVETSQRLFYLVAPSAEVMRIWIDVLFTGAEGYLLVNAPSTADLAPT